MKFEKNLLSLRHTSKARLLLLGGKFCTLQKKYPTKWSVDPLATTNKHTVFLTALRGQKGDLMINCTDSLLCSHFITFGSSSIDFKLQSSKLETKRIILGNGASCSQRRIGQLNTFTVLKEANVIRLLLGQFRTELNTCLIFYFFLFFGHSSSIIIYMWTDISALSDRDL